MAVATKCMNNWGDITIFEDSDLRNKEADSIALRLSLHQEFARDRMDLLHGMVSYEESRPGNS